MPHPRSHLTSLPGSLVPFRAYVSWELLFVNDGNPTSVVHRKLHLCVFALEHITGRHSWEYHGPERSIILPAVEGEGSIGLGCSSVCRVCLACTKIKIELDL